MPDEVRLGPLAVIHRGGMKNLLPCHIGVPLRPALAVLLAGGLGALAFPPVNAFPLIFISSALFLVVIRESESREARNLGLLYGAALGAGTMYWLENLFGPAVVPLVAIFAAYFGLLGHLTALTGRMKPLARSLLIAAFAVAIEWFRGEGPVLPFPWYSPVHALAIEPAWIAAARWLGTYGLSFAVWFVLGWGACGPKPAWLLLLLLPFASHLLPEFPAPDRRVLLIQGEEFGSLERLIRELPDSPVDLVVLPELAFAVEPEMAVLHPHGPKLAATRTGAPVVFGAVLGMYASDSFVNIAAIIDSNARLLGTFPKQRPVPLFMDGPPADRCPVFPMEEGILGVAICYDFDGPKTTARLVAQGATVLIMPTTDKIRWSETQHLHHELLQRLRAVESGRWLLRAASSGRSEAIDPHGVPSREGLDFAEEGVATIAFGHLSDRTLGSRMAILGPLALGGTILFVSLVLFATWRRRERSPGSQP